METRWMLYQERGDTLNIFRTIPRSWLEAGKRIVLKDVRSYFGSVDAVAEGIREGRLEAVVSCAGERKPRCVAVRLPHPGNPSAVESLRRSLCSRNGNGADRRFRRTGTGRSRI